MAILNLNISYPDFRLLDVINPEQFDANNAEIVAKVNEVVNKINAGLQSADIATGSLTGNNIANGSIGIDKLHTSIQQQFTNIVAGKDLNAERIRTIPVIPSIEYATVADHNKVLTYDNDLRMFVLKDKTSGGGSAFYPAFRGTRGLGRKIVMPSSTFDEVSFANPLLYPTTFTSSTIAKP